MASNDAIPAPGARAVARHVRVSPNKARRVVNLVRGLPATEALTVLKFAPQAASEPVYKVVASAIANAENNERLDPESLLIAEARVDEGPTMKRYRPRAHGRAYRIRKRTSHITIVVESVAAASAPVTAPRRPRRAATDTAAPAAEVTEATENETVEATAEDADSKTEASKKEAAK